MGGLGRDPYEVLGLPTGATWRQIQRAYRKLAMRHHPDRNPGDPQAHERFKEINSAYEELKSQHFRRESQEEALGRASSSEEDHPFSSFFLAMRRFMEKPHKHNNTS